MIRAQESIVLSGTDTALFSRPTLFEPLAPASGTHNAQAELIDNATIADDRLIVIACEPKTYEAGFDQMRALKNIPPRERAISRSRKMGSFIWWPSEDNHLNAA